MEQAEKLPNKTKVTLQGHIIERISDDDYHFQDNTGTVTVDIDDDQWAGQTVTPEDLVEIRGWVLKLWTFKKIVAEDIKIIQKTEGI